MKKKILSLILSLICFGLIALPANNGTNYIQLCSFSEETYMD